MKKISKAFVLIIILSVLSAAGAVADGCTYFAENGTHDWIYGRNQATCEADGEVWRECTVCDLREVQEVIPAAHSWNETSVTKEPTCTSAGEKLLECSVCGEATTETISALGHDYGEWVTTIHASCASSGQRKATCKKCGQEVYETIDRESHSYGDWTVTVEPDDHSMGRRTRRCSECGASSEEYFYPEGTLYRGMRKNDDVQNIQQMLIDLGFLDDVADGIFGKNTEQAVRDYQEHADLEVTGVAYPQTIDAITAEWEGNGNRDKDYYAENGFPACCGRIADDDGHFTVVFCEEHYETVLLCEEAASADAVEYWINLLDELYAEWGDPDADANREAFYAWLEAQKAVWNEICENDDEVNKRIIEAIMNQCADICSLIDR